MPHVRFRTVSCLLALIFLLPAATLRADELPPLRWGADAEGGAPFIFKDPQDPRRNIGFEVDLVTALEPLLGRKIVFRQYAFDGLMLGLERDDFDFAMNGLEVTPDRLARLRMSRAYYIYTLQLVVRADDTRFADLAGCKAIGGKVGTLGDTAASRLLDQEGLISKVYDGQAEPFQDLLLGRVDAVLVDLPVADYYARPNPKLTFVSPPFAPGKYAVAFRPNQEELAQRFDAAILTLAQSGELERIYRKWHIWNDAQAQLTGDIDIPDVIGQSGAQFTFDKYFPLLCGSAVTTIWLSVLSMLLAVAIGLLVAVARLYGPLPLRFLAVGYVEFFRGIPVLLLLYMLYYGLPSLLATWGIPWKPQDMTVAVIAF
ncbi:MAG TPA: ABC transporter permease subunit, partial [Pirellulaceae bacterium]|nr:ABC transporter permease subunit [Pirellulaceae bacterium]